MGVRYRTVTRTELTWDAGGHCTSIKTFLTSDPLGSPPTTSILYTYGSGTLADAIFSVVEDGVSSGYSYYSDGFSPDPFGIHIPRVKTFSLGAGDLVRIDDPLGNAVTINAYDALGDPLSASIYPDTGNPATSLTPLTTTIDWNAAQNPLSAVLANGVSVLNTYTNGQLTRTRHFAPAGAGGGLLSQVDYSIDSRGRLWQAADLVGTLAQWKYDNADNLRKVIDGRGNTTNISYAFKAMADRPNGISWPGGQSQTGTYDTLGRVATWTNERGIQAQFQYDNADRVTAILYPAYPTHNLAFTYDPAGRPLTIAAAGLGKSASFGYDAVTKQLASVTTTTPGPGGAPHTYTVSYVLSGDGHRKSMTSPSGTVNYSWNAGGQITSLTDSLGQTTTYGYDKAGRPTSQTSVTRQGVTIQTVYTYGPSGQAGDPSTAPVYLRQIAQTVNGQPVRTYTLKHSYLGQLLQRDGVWSGGRSESFVYGYDPRGRLTSESATIVLDPNHINPPDVTAQATFNYDAANNLNGDAVFGFPPPPTWTYNSNNQLTSAPAMNGMPGATGLSWDPAGNLLTMDGMTFGYDIWNQMTSVTGSPAGPVSYTYDLLGRRDSKTVNGVTTFFEYDGDALIAEKNGSGAITSFYTWGPLGMIAGAFQTGASYLTKFFLDDDQGDTRLTVNEGGTQSDEASFRAYNAYLLTTLPAHNMGSKAGQRDGETGFHYSPLHGYYSERTGQYLQSSAPGTIHGSPYSNGAGSPMEEADDEWVLGGNDGSRQSYYDGFRSAVNKGAGYAEAGLNFAASFNPIANAITLVTGRDAAGKKVTGVERALSVLGITGLPVGGAVKATGGAGRNAPRALRGLSNTVSRSRPIQRFTQEEGYEAENLFRSWLERDHGLPLQPKGHGATGGPDAVVKPTDKDPGWLFAELRPDHRSGRGKGGSVVRRRLRNGQPGPGALYGYKKDDEGNFVFRLIRIWADPNP